MSDKFDEAMFGEPPLIYTNDGEGRLPKDIWVTACRIAAAFHAVEDGPALGNADIDADAMLRTLIATSLLKEREGWGRKTQ